MPLTGSDGSPVMFEDVFTSRRARHWRSHLQRSRLGKAARPRTRLGDRGLQSAALPSDRGRRASASPSRQNACLDLPCPAKGPRPGRARLAWSASDLLESRPGLAYLAWHAGSRLLTSGSLHCRGDLVLGHASPRTLRCRICARRPGPPMSGVGPISAGRSVG